MEMCAYVPVARHVEQTPALPVLLPLDGFLGLCMAAAKRQIARTHGKRGFRARRRSPFRLRRRVSLRRQFERAPESWRERQIKTAAAMKLLRAMLIVPFAAALGVAQDSSDADLNAKVLTLSPPIAAAGSEGDPDA
jgi:hypothetical protein